MDLHGVFQDSINEWMRDPSWSLNLATPHLPIAFRGSQSPAPPAHSSFAEPDHISFSLTAMSSQDLFPTASTLAYADHASITGISPHPALPAADLVFGQSHVPTYQNPNWTFHNPASVPPSTRNPDTPHPPRPGPANTQRAPEGTLRASRTL